MLNVHTWERDITLALLFLSFAINIWQSARNERLACERDSWKIAAEHWESEYIKRPQLSRSE